MGKLLAMIYKYINVVCKWEYTLEEAIFKVDFLCEDGPQSLKLCQKLQYEGREII